jgi:FkbM family methyltransferase
MTRSRDPFYEFVKIKPIDITGAVRLYIGFSSAILVKLLRLKKRLTNYQIPGAFVPGSSTMIVRIEGFYAEIRPRTGDLVIIAGMHEPITSSWFKVNNGDTVVDVGAHIGRYSLGAATNAERVIAIEPDPTNFSLLERNLKLNHFANVTALNIAASESEGDKVLFEQSGDNTGTSSLEANWAARANLHDNRAEVKVHCRPLDDIIRLLKVNHIEWLKIDVEGHELSVLKGAPKTLGITSRMIIEVSDQNKEPCSALLKSAGFTLISKESGLLVSNWFAVKAGGM